MLKATSLSVLVPAYNEAYTVNESLKRLLVLKESNLFSKIQVVIVDDGSTDETAKIIEEFLELGETKIDNYEWVFLKHQTNLGKGKAIQTALNNANCEITVIHDADLEYYPKDILKMIPLFIEEQADAVFGSRFAASEFRRVLMYRHQLGNKFITFFCNLFSNLNLTDVETCYKAVRTDLLKSIPIESNDFRIEPEIVIKIAKRKARVFEVPINYSGRTYDEGKKIRWIDGLKAVCAIIKFGFDDNVFQNDAFEAKILLSLTRARNFNRWLAETINPYIGQNVLEVGAGIGNITKAILPRKSYYATDINSYYLKMVESIKPSNPGLNTRLLDLNYIDTIVEKNNQFDTVICMNVIEHVNDDQGALKNISKLLSDNGRAIVLVPRGMWLFGSQDEVLGHKRRYSKENISKLASDAHFEIENFISFNKISTLPWYVNGKLFNKKNFSRFQIKFLDVFIPMLKKIDKFLPWPSLSVIAILKKKI
jgi:glycosyltransferase involved in cell wall biosynthesis